MSKKRDPVLAVLQYFQEAELPLAKQALTLAGAIVKTRAPVGQGAFAPRAVAKPAAKPVAKKPGLPGPVATVGGAAGRE